MRKNRGFTLIELMIVVAILAIIVAIALPAARGPGRMSSNLPEYKGGLYIYTDRDTGCQYVQSGSDKALTPRMGVDGKQVCKGH